uniref:F-box domain-containing protein n=1 Tax=Meloidogyne hapla TaxID=6305 RepID=A0A1I8B0W5_MELHA
MYSLPTEVQFDVFKYLNFNQLFSIKQTNLYFRNFINEYENKFARMEFDTISNCIFLENNSQLIKPLPEAFDFSVTRQLEDKWKNAIERSIPLCLHKYKRIRKTVFVCFSEEVDNNKSNNYNIDVSNFPKSIEEMKIIRYYLEKLFNCAFKYAYFTLDIFNPEMIEILFDENKTNIPLQIHTKSASLSISNKFEESFLKFALNHLIVSRLQINFNEVDNTEKWIDILLKILTNGGNKFSTVRFRSFDLPEIYKFILQVK